MPLLPLMLSVTLDAAPLVARAMSIACCWRATSYAIMMLFRYSALSLRHALRRLFY